MSEIPSHDWDDWRIYRLLRFQAERLIAQERQACPQKKVIASYLLQWFSCQSSLRPKLFAYYVPANEVGISKDGEGGMGDCVATIILEEDNRWHWELRGSVAAGYSATQREAQEAVGAAAERALW